MVTNPLFYSNRYAPFIILTGCILLQGWIVSVILGYFGSPLIWDSVLSWFFLALIIFFITHTFSYFQPARQRFWVSILLPTIMTSIWWGMSHYALQWLIADDEYLSFYRSSLYFRLTVVYLILLGITIISMIWYQLSEKEDLQKRKDETEKMLRDAELFKLRQQLQPHFLFNSLNSINSLIGSRPEMARSMVQQLSDFLRGTVRREDQMLVALREELQYLKNYLDIEQVRFGHRLVLSQQHSEEALQAEIPPLLIQPLLENAIKYGLYGTTGAIEITFRSYLSESYLKVEIANPIEERHETVGGTGFGLKSVQRRLYLLYGRSDLLKINQGEQTFLATLKIPLTYDKSIDH